MADFALAFFMKVVDNLLIFSNHLESNHLDLCSLRYCQFTQRYSSCIFADFSSYFEWPNEFRIWWSTTIWKAWSVSSIFKKIIFAFEDSKIIRYQLKSQIFNLKYKHAFKSNLSTLIFLHYFSSNENLAYTHLNKHIKCSKLSFLRSKSRLINS